MAMRIVQNRQREIPDGDKLLMAVSERSNDPELDYLKQFYREKFKKAFHEAMRTLEPRERNLLRHRLVDNMGIDEIGALFKIHRSTAARWIEKVRRTLSERSRDLMIAGLKLTEYEYESIVRSINSQLDFTISVYLERGPADLEDRL